MELTLKPDWIDGYNACIKDWSKRSFNRGQNDCVAFFCAMVKSMTGEDWYEPFRGTYKTDIGAERVYKCSGGFLNNLIKLAEKHSIPSVKPFFAQRGSLAVMRDINDFFEIGTRESLGIIGATGVYVFSHNGLIIVPLKSVTHTWRINLCLS